MTWPTEAECPKFYGPKGENQTSIILPYPMVLDWSPKEVIKKMTCHEKVADSMLNIFNKLLDEYGTDELKRLGIDQFGGCLNVRLKRGSKSSWSIHSYGVAVDLDPDRNTLRMTMKQAQFGKPEYIPMWKIIEGEGAVSLGRVKNYDPMHWQFARL